MKRKLIFMLLVVVGRGSLLSAAPTAPKDKSGLEPEKELQSAQCSNNPSQAQIQALQLDVAFLIDASSTITLTGFKSVINLLAEGVFPVIPINSGGLRLSAFTYGPFVNQYGNFLTCSSAMGCGTILRSAIDDYLGFINLSDLTTPLKRIHGLFTTGNGARANAPDVIVILTATNPHDAQSAIQQAGIWKNAGATIIVVGLGNQVNYGTLQSIASPGSLFLISTANPVASSQYSVVAKEMQQAFVCAQQSSATTTPPPTTLPPTTTPGTTRTPLTPPPWFANIGATIDELTNFLIKGRGSGTGYNWFTGLADKFGPRVVTSPALNATIDYLLNQLKIQMFDNVHAEPVRGIPNWVRGTEEAMLILPRQKKMSILGIGNTVSTPNGQPLTAEAIVVADMNELNMQGQAGNVAGKIVVYNQNWTTYGAGYQYRAQGAINAAKYGAVAALIRSVTPFSIYSPHTGNGHLSKTAKNIPMVSITVEDALMLSRMQSRGQQIKIQLKVTSGTNGQVVARDTVFEITGNTLPNEIVLLSGHLDSWDVGEGAMDDLGGCAIAWQALNAMKALNLYPKRTIRVVLWGSEERGPGGDYYYGSHKNNPNEIFKFVSESDMGAWKPADRSTARLAYWGNNTMFNTLTSKNLLWTVSDFMTKYGVNFGIEDDYSPGGDIAMWEAAGVSGVNYYNYDRYEYYFNFHHTQGDFPNILTPEDLDYSSSMWASVAWAFANA